MYTCVHVIIHIYIILRNLKFVGTVVDRKKY